jgi:5-oxoprolinase (ATP-hydrolysing)
VEIWKEVNEEKLRQDLTVVFSKGIRNLAVVLMHAYTYVMFSLSATITLFVISIHRFTQHEEQVRQIAESIGFTHVSISLEAMPMVRIVPRGCTGELALQLFQI